MTVLVGRGSRMTNSVRRTCEFSRAGSRCQHQTRAEPWSSAGSRLGGSIGLATFLLQVRFKPLHKSLDHSGASPHQSAITNHLSPITNHFSPREPKASAVAEDQISF